ncbi:MAG: endonuclease/exonuclease/phosphatase family protein [Thermodesulfobacteriota bacterium]
MHHGNINGDTARGLKELRKRIKKADVPLSALDKSLNLATWNIREFGRRNRLDKSIHYIAEILGQFDLVAITEVRRNVRELAQVLDILGPYWKVVYSDFTTDYGGNKERVAYIYDKRNVAFTGLAAEVDAFRKKDKKTGEYRSEFSWWRSPYIASFRSGNFDFILITAHIRWSSGSKARIKPLELLAEWIDKRRRDPYCVDKDIILLGDFNIPKIDDALFKAITSKGLRMPKALRGLDHGSNLAKNKRYDQILHYPTHSGRFTNKAGVVDFYTEGIAGLYPGAGMSKYKFTNQVSDHLPLWVQINTDIADARLDQIIAKSMKKKRRAARR